MDYYLIEIDKLQKRISELRIAMSQNKEEINNLTTKLEEAEAELNKMKEVVTLLEKKLRNPNRLEENLLVSTLQATIKSLVSYTAMFTAAHVLAMPIATIPIEETQEYASNIVRDFSTFYFDNLKELAPLIIAVSFLTGVVINSKDFLKRFAHLQSDFDIEDFEMQYYNYLELIKGVNASLALIKTDIATKESVLKEMQADEKETIGKVIRLKMKRSKIKQEATDKYIELAIEADINKAYLEEYPEKTLSKQKKNQSQ